MGVTHLFLFEYANKTGVILGAFILICFVFWIGWRMLKKSKRRKYGDDMRDFSPPNPLFARIPYLGRNQRGWQDLDERGGAPPMYDTKSMRSRASMYSMNDPRLTAQSPLGTNGPAALPELQTNFTYSFNNNHPFSASTATTILQPQSAHSIESLANMQNALRASQGQQMQQQQQSMVLPPLQTNFNNLSNAASNPFESPHDTVVHNTTSPYSASQYGTMQTFDTMATDRSRMPDAFFNQSELARQASSAYDPAQRAVYRASELSSISSGFGDGDIIVPPMPTLQQEGGVSRPVSFAKSTGRTNSMAAGQRDTVYTTTSEDMPARYRTVSSWVNQQTGRVQRQQDRDGDVPPVPALPAEERFTMMMDDGQEPRRYEDTLSSQQSVPVIPAQLNNTSQDASQSQANISSPEEKAANP